MGQGARPRPNPFGEGRATGQLLMGSRVITVSMWRGSPRGRARNEWDPGLSRNRFKTNDLWKKVSLGTLLYAIRIVDSGIAMYYSLPPPFCFLPWSRIVQKTQIFLLKCLTNTWKDSGWALWNQTFYNLAWCRDVSILIPWIYSNFHIVMIGCGTTLEPSTRRGTINAIPSNLSQDFL